MLKVVRWGIIGCGDVTEHKSGPAFAKCENSELVAVMRRDAAKAQDYAKRHGVANWFDDAIALIQCPDVDAVYIATPPSSHAELALAVARAGKPAYVEKPLAVNVADAEHVVETFKTNGVPLFAAYYRRGLPRFEKVAAILRSGDIGEIRSVNLSYASPKALEITADDIPWRFTKAIGGGGLFVDLASHALDIVDFLLGPLTDVAGIHSRRKSAPYEVEDCVSMQFRVGNTMGVGQWNFASSEYHDRVELLGTSGKLVFSVFGDGAIELTVNGEKSSFMIENPDHIQQPLIQAVVHELTGQGASPSTGQTALRTTKVMCEVLGIA